MSEYQIVPYEYDNEISVVVTERNVWMTQAAMQKLFDVSQQAVSRHVKNLYDQAGMDPDRTHNKYLLVQNEGKRRVRRNIDHYNLDVDIAIGFRLDYSEKAVQFRQWATKVLSGELLQNMQQLPAPKSRHLLSSFNKHGHTEVYQKERLDNVEQRKQLTGELSRTIDGQVKYPQLMGMFHISVTGKTKSQLLKEYEHATKRSAAIDALGSMVVNQINLLMQSVRLILEQYPDDYIPDDDQISEFKRIIDPLAENIRDYLVKLSDRTGIPIEKLGENSHKRRLL